MSATILTAAIAAAQLALAVAIVLAASRIIVGPRAHDRVLGLDTLYVNTMLLFLTLGIRTGTVFFFEAAIVIATLGFVATLALAKFLMRGEVIE
jgi:multicomponent K+:H+ antiporter subunit F